MFWYKACKSTDGTQLISITIPIILLHLIVVLVIIINDLTISTLNQETGAITSIILET